MNKLNTTGVCLMIPSKTPFSQLNPKCPSQKKEVLHPSKAKIKHSVPSERRKGAVMMRISTLRWDVWIQKEPFRQCLKTERKERRSKTLQLWTGLSTTRGGIKCTKAKYITVRTALWKTIKQISWKSQIFHRKAIKYQRICKP